jgi:geranylgeranyl diphosphate synthase, type I
MADRGYGDADPHPNRAHGGGPAAGAAVAVASGPAAGAAAPDIVERVAGRVDQRLTELLDRERCRWSALDPALDDAFDSISDLVHAGGKRLRPVFCALGHRGAGGTAADADWLDAAVALELLHTFALVHDDVMDGSSVRRSRATVHIGWGRRHRHQGWRGDARRFGEGMAILVGDLAFVLADVALGDVDPRVRRIYDELRMELHVGQYLDLLGTAQGSRDLDAARTVAVFKSGKYTVERPLHLGAALVDGLDRYGPCFTAYGLPLGEAFQLRDDLLGAFGDERTVGKPVGDDFREGKPTLLVAVATAAATERDDRAALAVLGGLGDPDLGEGDVADMRTVLEELGARAAIEARIDALVETACGALDEVELQDGASDSLVQLALYTAARTV